MPDIFEGSDSIENIQTTKFNMENIIRKIRTKFKNQHITFSKKIKSMDPYNESFSALPDAAKEYCLQLKEENDRLRQALTSCWHVANDYSGEYAKACDGVMTIVENALKPAPEEDNSDSKEENLKRHAEEIRQYLAKLEKWMVTPGWKTVHLAAYTMQKNEELTRVITSLKRQILELQGSIAKKEAERVSGNDYSFESYQKEASSTAIYSEKVKIVYPALGLSEAGEVQGKVKKVLRDNNGEFTPEINKEIGKELGDVLWYIAALSRDLGLNMGDIARQNIEKLKSRKSRGVIGGSGDNR